MTSYQIPGYVYKITHLTTGEYYYGSRSANIKKKRRPIDDFMKHYFSSSKRLNQMIETYGLNSFQGEIIFESTCRDEIFWYAQNCIKMTINDPLIINCYYVDQSSKTKVFGWTEENLAIMTSKIKQNVANGTHNFLGGELQRQAQLKRLAAGTHTSQDPVWLENHRAKQRSAETRERKSQSLKLFNQSELGIQRRQEYMNSETYKNNHRSGMLLYYASNPEARHSNGVKAMMAPEIIQAKNQTNIFNNRTKGNNPWFICENTGQIYCNLKHASEELPISGSGIGMVLKGRFKEMKGLTFRYLTQAEVETWLKSPQYQSLVQSYRQPSSDQK
jgi:hypothetical protein